MEKNNESLNPIDPSNNEPVDKKPPKPPIDPSNNKLVNMKDLEKPLRKLKSGETNLDGNPRIGTHKSEEEAKMVKGLNTRLNIAMDEKIQTDTAKSIKDNTNRTIDKLKNK